MSAPAMPRALTASLVLARAVGLAQRAEQLAERAPDPFTRTESAAIQLGAWNVRTLLSDALRGSIPSAATLDELERRLQAGAHQLDALAKRRPAPPGPP